MRPLTLEDGLYLLAFGLALFLRLFHLGAAPLSDAEATWALQALEIARGGQPLLGAQPGYILLTGLAFGVLSATGFLARLLPAVAGSLLVLLPILLRPWLGETPRLRWSGLILAFGLAVDPGLVVLSRTAGSQMPALAFSLLALALFARRRMIAAGIAAGLALLSGPALLHGALILALSWGAYRLMVQLLQRLPREEASEPVRLLELPPIERPALRNGLLALGGTIFIAGLLFLRFPGGLGALASTLPEYLRGWVEPSGIPALRLPVTLGVYQTLAVVLALIAAWRAWWHLLDSGRRERLAAGLSLWVLIGLLVAMLYPARQAGDLAWALVPLWGLAALELPRHLPGIEHRSIRLVAAGLATLLCILAVVMWVNLLNIGRYQVNTSLYWIVLLGALLLGAVSTLLVAAGWSTLSARMGVVWAMTVVLGVILLSATWGAAYIRPHSALELWSTSPTVGQADLLVRTLTDLSRRSTGHDTEIEIVLLDDSPALQWALRQFPNLRTASLLAVTDAPPVVIAAQTAQTPSLAQAYRGQDLVWRIRPAWETALPPNFTTWLAFRQAPLTTEQLILWARGDLFPGGLEALSGEADAP